MDILIMLGSLLFTAVMFLVTIAAVAVSFLIPMAIAGFVLYRVLNGQAQVVVSGPLAHAIAASATPTTPPKLNLVKVGTCHACGAHRTTPSASAYVHCDCCGQLNDWDFKAAMSDPRSKAPGPAYEALVARKQSELTAAKATGDRDRYQALQTELWEAYANTCPAACPPRVGDSAYRKRWVDWTARAQTLQDLDERCAATFLTQQQATAALQWDRSNPFQPMVVPSSFDTLLAAVLAHQQRVVDTLIDHDLLDEHPDRPDHEVFQRIGVSALVQGWLPYLPESRHQPLLEKTGLDGEYIEPPEVDLTDGTCPTCSAELHVPANAKRVVCVACGHCVSVGGGELPCLGCGAPIEIPADADDVSCSFCDTHVRRIGIG